MTDRLATCASCGLVFRPHELVHPARGLRLPEPPIGLTVRHAGTIVIASWPLPRFAGVMALFALLVIGGALTTALPWPWPWPIWAGLAFVLVLFGYLAAAGLYALDHHVDRLRDDHRKARALEAELQKMSYVSEVLPVETNIVIFKLDPAMSTERFLGHLNERGVKALSLGPRMIRIVFHLDVSDAQFDALVGALRSLH